MVLRYLSHRGDPLSPTGLSPSTARLSSLLRLANLFLTRRRLCRTVQTKPTTPHRQRLQPSTPVRFGLFPVRSPLLGESRLISFPPATEMFHFAGLPGTDCSAPSPPYCAASCLVRESPVQRSLAPYRGLSQPAAPFVVDMRLGIHRTPLLYFSLIWKPEIIPLFP